MQYAGNAAADRVPAGVPSVPPRKGRQELVEGKGHRGKAELMALTQPRSPRASGAPRLAGSREAWGREKDPVSTTRWDREQFDKSFKKRTKINSYDNKDTALILNKMSYSKLLPSLRMPRRKEPVLVAVL